MRIKVFCASCKSLLMRYDKRGSGALVKLDPRRILTDYTAASAPLECPEPSCAAPFARNLISKGRPFRKLLGGKVRVVGGGISSR